MTRDIVTPRPSGPAAAARWTDQGLRPIAAVTGGQWTPFTVRAPASSANLGPGFDALGLALDLWNEVDVDPTVERDRITITGRDAGMLGGDANAPHENLVLRAMRQLAENHGWGLPPVALSFRNAIPVSRGLGSSAAALIAGLLATDALLGLGLTRDEIYAHAWRMEGHGDNVGAALYGGAILAVPGVPHAIPLLSDAANRALGNLTAVLFVPDATGATWAARAALPERIPHTDAAYNLAMAAGLASGLLTGDRQVLAASMNDRLHEPYRARLFPHLTAIARATTAAGAIGACLSGAGPTVLALTAAADASAVARAVSAAGTGIPGETMTLPVVFAGASLALTRA